MAIERRLFWLPLVSGIGYGVIYLYAIGDLSVAPPPAWDVRMAPLSLEQLLRARGPFLFEALAMIEAGYVVLVSPLNLLMAALLAGLLAANIHGAVYMRANPASYSSGRGGLVASATPALFAGGACCAPSLILLLGVPGLGAFTALFSYLLPLSIVALALNRVWQRRRGAPAILRVW